MDSMQTGAVAGLITGGVVLMKILERSIDWALRARKSSKEPVTVVRLDEETSRTIKDTHERVRSIDAIMQKSDPDGVPMVYFPRSTADGIKTIAECMRDVSTSQERITLMLDKLEMKLDAIRNN